MTKNYNLSELNAAAYNYVTYAASYVKSIGCGNYVFDCYLSKGMVLWINPETYERFVTLVLSNGQVVAFKESL